MLEAALVNHCAPTLAGIKTGNIFPLCAEEDGFTAEMRNLILNSTLHTARLPPIYRSNNFVLTSSAMACTCSLLRGSRRPWWVISSMKL